MQPRIVQITGNDTNRKIKVSEIASKPIHCISHDTNLQEAASLMEENNISRLFVCDGEKIIGVASLIDLMSAALIRRAKENYLTQGK